MSSKLTRLKRRALVTPPTAPAVLAAVAVAPVGAAPVGRQAGECGLRKMGWQLVSVIETARTGRWLLVRLLTFSNGSTGSWE